MSHIVTIFRSRLRPEHAEEYHRLAPQIERLAKSMAGFVAFKSFAAPDGERVSIVEFASEAAHNAWRDHAQHRAAQKLGREKFYAEFRIQVCRIEKDHGMPGVQGLDQ
jgi:heme-degrading monooxygenase HmoA